MVQRSIVPAGDRVGDVAGAIDWLLDRRSGIFFPVFN
jgi:hypothetical protein